MKTSIKISLIIIALVLLALFVVLRLRRDEPVTASVPNPSGGPSFEVLVVKPLSARPLFGLLPDEELRFDHTSRGAQISSVEHNRLGLSADGWDLFIEINNEGKVGPGTYLVFPITFGDRHVRLRCRPADPATGYLHITTREGSDELDGIFLVKLATCRNDESGKSIEWPPAPLTVRGSFEGLSQPRR